MHTDKKQTSRKTGMKKQKSLSAILTTGLRTYEFKTGEKMQIIFISCGLASIVDYQRASYSGTPCIAFMSVQNPF